jgi:hypothetical protein
MHNVARFIRLLTRAVASNSHADIDAAPAVMPTETKWRNGGKIWALIPF